MRVSTSSIRAGGRCTRECSATTLAIPPGKMARVLSPSRAPEGARGREDPFETGRAGVLCKLLALLEVVVCEFLLGDPKLLADGGVGEV